MSRYALVVVAAAWVAGCLTPVDAGSNTLSNNGGGGSAPAAPRPNVLVLLDKSGSMALDLDPNCADCGTRLSALRAALEVTLASHPATARLSLAAFPTNSVCGEADAPAKVRVPALAPAADSEAQVSAQSAAVKASIQLITSSGVGDNLVTGGTPTAAALRQVADLPALTDATRPNMVLLITDGLPNCSGTNPNNCTDPTACRCTLSSCGTSTAAQFCSLGCLADTETSSAIALLRQRGIRTIVLGLGPEVGGGSGETLSQMAVAGGGPSRTCTTDNDCRGGADSCDTQTGTCRLPYFHGSTSADLQAELLKIFSLL